MLPTTRASGRVLTEMLGVKMELGRPTWILDSFRLPFNTQIALTKKASTHIPRGMCSHPTDPIGRPRRYVLDIGTLDESTAAHTAPPPKLAAPPVQLSMQSTLQRAASILSQAPRFARRFLS